ncbi:hypothetical protein BGLA2_680007 [Burkholderia gladioli]|nr:hypothetical protein BGLA2_680007 [Burkholderia gladioli]
MRDFRLQEIRSLPLTAQTEAAGKARIPYNYLFNISRIRSFEIVKRKIQGSRARSVEAFTAARNTGRPTGIAGSHNPGGWGGRRA